MSVRDPYWSTDNTIEPSVVPKNSPTHYPPRGRATLCRIEIVKEEKIEVAPEVWVQEKKARQLLQHAIPFPRAADFFPEHADKAVPSNNVSDGDDSRLVCLLVSISRRSEDLVHDFTAGKRYTVERARSS